MLGLALRYLVVVVVVGAGFGLLQESEVWRPREGATATRSRAARTAPEGAPGLVIRAGPHGHFMLDAEVDYEPVRFLVDTGASDLVLTLDDAERIGLRRHELRFTRQYQTANGIVRAAPVTLREVRIGGFSLYDVDAAVNEGQLDVSLLGMGVLRRLGGYRVEGDRLYLYW